MGLIYGQLQEFIGLITLYAFTNIKGLFSGRALISFRDFKKTLSTKDNYQAVVNDFSLKFIGFIVVLIIAFIIAD